jgi:transglutaminase superfamily protein
MAGSRSMTVSSRRSSSSWRMAFLRVVRLPVRDQLATFRVLALAAVVEIAVRTLPLPRLARWLGIALVPPARSVRPLYSLNETERRQVRAVERVLRRWSIAPGPCLRKALVMGYFLRRHKPVLRIGVMRRNGLVLAHAWLDFGEISINTGEQHQPFAPLDPHDPACVSSATQEAKR